MDPVYGYGAAPKSHVAQKKKRMNVIAILLSIVLPWLIFCAVYAARTFSTRYKQPTAAFAIVVGALIVVILCFGLAIRTVHRKRSGDPTYQPMWYIFLAFTALLAFILALVGGEWNWNTYMNHSVNIGHLNEYWYVDPARMRGQQMMDAGVVYFVNTTFLDLKLSMGFRNNGVYCVAPITSVPVPLASYDFWAIGKDCCSSSAADFRCGQYNSQAVHAGMRLMTDSDRPFYRLAVQQAEGAYGIRAQHPLFFHWIMDPDAEKAKALLDGWKYYGMGMYAHFLLQLFLVITVSCCFAQCGAY